MNRSVSDYFSIGATIGLTVYGQLILKWRVRELGQLPTDRFERLKFLAGLVLDPVIFSGFAAAFLAALAWITALYKFDLSHAYPFMSLNFVIVLLSSWWVLNESLSAGKVMGAVLIVVGTVVSARG